MKSAAYIIVASFLGHGWKVQTPYIAALIIAVSIRAANTIVLL